MSNSGQRPGQAVADTGTLVAAIRAEETRRPDRLFEDPFAERLAGEAGRQMLADAIATSGDKSTLQIVVRTRFWDEALLSAVPPVKQVVILAAGLDARAYRLPWPDGTVVYELDQPAVIGAKTATMAQIGATPTAERRTVAIDLRDDWPAALQAAGFDPTAPSAWSAEGLLAYLPPDAQDRLFDNITELSAPGSRLATEFHPDIAANLRERGNEMSEQWRKHGLDLDLANLWYDGERNSVTEYLGGSGWSVTARRRPELFAEYGREFPAGDAAAPQRNSQAVIAIRD
jgi:methyltransferase (TIGR00027 family)